MPNLNEQAIVKIAQEVINTRGLQYDLDEGFIIRYLANEKLRDGQIKSVWIVSYVTAPGFIDQHDHFMYIDDTIGSFLYIMTQTGYVD